MSKIVSDISYQPCCLDFVTITLKGSKKNFQSGMTFTTFKCCVEQIRKIRNVTFTVLEKRLVKSFDKNRQQEIFFAVHYRNMMKVQKVSSKQ